MKVTSGYIVRLGRTVKERKSFDSASALFADLPALQWTRVIAFINGLVAAPSIGIEHPDGKEWRFVVLFNFQAVRAPKTLRSVSLVTWPKIGDYQVPPIELKPDFNPEELRRRIVASLPAFTV